LSAELERYALKTELNDISVDTSHLATKSSVNELSEQIATKADLSHTHTMSEVTDLSAELERYALKTELNDISVDTSHLATKSSVNELSEQIATKADQSHRHTITEVSGLQGILNNKLNSNASARSAQKLTTPRRINGIAFDGTQDITLPTPTANVSWSAISNKPTNFTPSAHRHAISDITNLQRELDNKAPRNHSHTWNSITNKPANFTPSAHTHQWSNISNVPSATINNAGIVQLSNSTNGVRQTIAATEFALNEVRKLINSSSRRGSITGVLNRQSHRYFYQRRHGTSSTDAVYSDIDTFTFPDGRIVCLVRLEGIKPAFFDVNTASVGGSDHTPAKIINLPTAMPNKIISAIPQITSSSLGNTLSSCIVGWDWTYNIDPISGNTRSKSQVRIQFSGYQGNTTNNKIDLSIIVEGY
ncbi:tail fiber protein, partial [Moraxella catarrhalis]|uniref:tail fiber protein n=1 Tax=Moraxella catarrhalis TaxID=480 RepID=UPI0012C103EF